MKIWNSRPKPKKDASKQANADTGTGPTPDYQRMMRVIGGDAKGHALNRLITSDDSNAIKSSNANPFNLAVMDVMGHWEEAEDEGEIIQLFLNGRARPADMGEIEGGYRINKMAEDFRMTQQYIEGFKAWTLLGGQGMVAPPKTLTEGNKE